ncbi:MAG: M23 family metallopeptidase [Patescibacteria group bacterium]
MGATLLNLILMGGGRSGLDTFGGPEALASVAGAFSDSLESDNNPLEEFRASSSDEDFAGFILIDESSFLGASNPLSDILPTRDGLMVYKVQAGDTLSQIAARFGISLNTILWANSNLRSNFISPGQEIMILPISGVAHVVEDGETVSSIANLYQVDAEKILKYNPKASMAGLPMGTTLIIPGAKPIKSLSRSSASGLMDIPGYFIMPTKGWNWGRLHPTNAVDIANACGTPIYAAAEGLVTDEKSYGWNGGYGHFIDIEHPNNTLTRYSHTQTNVVSVGDYVLQGDLIGYIGNTGNTHGPTGCHLHFEVRGAKNPFVK